MGKWARTLRVAIATALMTLAVPAALVATAEPAAATACAAASQALWGVGNCDQYASGNGIVVEDVIYDSTATDPVEGRVCRPLASGSYPIAVINHSGFGSNDTWTDTTCTAFALAHYIAIAPDYRPFASGEDVLCDGEVDDVLAMLDVIQQHPDADEDRVVMRGTSHGACVTLRAYQRGVPGLVAAAAIAPPTDIDEEWDWVVSQLNPFNLANKCGLPQSLGLSSPNCPGWRIVKDALDAAIGGGPGTYPSEYADRSVNTDLAGLHNSAVPLLIVQGDDDPIVPPVLTCGPVAGVDALAGTPDFAAYHFTSSGTALTATAPASCSGFTWNTASNPTSTGYPLDHYFFAYAGYGHGDGTTTMGSLEHTIYGQANAFLVAKT
jgi:pimeloyl-ACP methyl ester carboxylesterase